MTGNFLKIRVLAVDDNRTNLHILQVFLKKLGHEVILAENGEIAVQRFIEEAPDVILLDIMMPVMDGFEAARRIKASSPEKWVPIIFLSALNRDENLVEGLESGADDYLTKPINFVVLEAKLRSIQRTLTMQQSANIALQRLRAVSDNVLDAIVTTDSQGTIITVNRATSRIFGLPDNALSGRPLALLLPALPSDWNQRINQPASQDGEVKITVSELESIGRHASGRDFPVEIGCSRLHIEGEERHVVIIRDITQRRAAEQKLQENARQLQAYFDHNQSEQQLALRLMEKQLHRPGLSDSRIHYKVTPSENFSGDIVAASRSPEGRCYAMLGDATGHGLPAAISVLPVLALFYRMSRLNCSIREMVVEMNQQLRESVPVGRFVAATLVALDAVSLTGEIWVGGTPQAMLLAADGSPVQDFPSKNLALGILDSQHIDCQPVAFEWQKNSQLLMFSDGVLEATNEAGEQFGMDGILAAIRDTSAHRRFSALDQALSTHLGRRPASDDISLMLIDCP